jgi:hypothetical protein
MYEYCYGFMFLFLVLLPGRRKGFLIKIKMNKQNPVR